MTAVYTDAHSKVIGYLLWIFGFTGGPPVLLRPADHRDDWFFTGGLLPIGWLIDLFLIPRMDRLADWRYRPGPYRYNVAWILLTFLGLFGIHRFYLGKWVTGLVYVFSGALLGPGYLFDLWSLNEQVDQKNAEADFHARQPGRPMARVA